MRKFKRLWPVRSHTFRSLLLVAGVFVLTAALAPKAKAQNVLIYFNFEDATIPGPFDAASDEQPAFGGDNPGGGVQHSTMETNLVATGAIAGTLLNRTVGDSDTNNPGVGMGLRTTVADNGHWIQFHANTTTFSNMSLSFAVNTQGNGFKLATFSYIINGVETSVSSQTLVQAGGFHIHTFTVPSAANGQTDVIFRLTFTGGTSNGNNLETTIDNVQLTGVVPEPATVAGGLLGVLGLCWHQRRRLRLILPRSRRA